MNRSRLLLLGLSIFALLCPIGVYIYTFGIDISKEHTRWSEMGSAMAGIYGPIIAVVTLLMLFRQTSIMAKAVELQEKTAELQAEQAAHHSAEKDFEMRWDRLKECVAIISRSTEGISSPLDKIKLLNIVHYQINPPKADESVDTKKREYAREEHYKSPELMDTWISINICLTGLKDDESGSALLRNRRRNEFEKMRLYVVTSLSMPVCTTLDSFLFCIDFGGQPEFYFKSDLNGDQMIKPASPS